MKGNVKFFNQGKGFGFISGEDGNEYFVHVTGINAGVTITDNDAVTFDVEEGERGLKAANVSLDDGSASTAPADEEPVVEESAPEEEPEEEAKSEEEAPAEETSEEPAEEDSEEEKKEE